MDNSNQSSQNSASTREVASTATITPNDAGAPSASTELLVVDKNDSYVSDVPSAPGEPSEDAVLVRRAYKHYGTRRKQLHILVDFEMTVAKGTIYGLLGPSGAGKTTLLSCLVGRKKLHSGEIWVLGGKPGTKDSCVPGKCVGYMPQELALYDEFTMNDMMMYFGRIYGMKKNEINDRTAFLMELLDLTTKSRKIKNLSGGQQRRVSLAVALMHKPDLLILDEPTVGVDPVLRQIIWSHLVDLVNVEKTTVIITTHYIEEARQAHKIGLMRGGKLLAEDSPENLLRDYEADSLEAVFLKLAYTQTELPTIYSKYSSIEMKQKKKKRGNPMKDLRMKANQMHALIHKNFLQLWRNPGIILFFLALPIVQVILFCTAIGGEPSNLLLGIVNDEIADVATTQVCPFEHGCNFVNVSCRYLYYLDQTVVDLVYVKTTKEARELVLDGDAWGMMHFDAEYSFASALKHMQPTSDVLAKSQIAINLDMSDQQINYMIQRDLMQSYIDFAKQLLTDCNESVKRLDMPFVINEPIYGPSKPSFKDFAAPGIIITIIFFLSVGQTAISLISEQLEGMLDRTAVAGVSSTQILFSHVLCQFIILLCQTALVLFFTLDVFRVICHGSVPLIITLTILQGVCGMCYGYVISAACDVERTAIQIALGSFYPCILLSGVIWPVEGMHWVMRYIAYCTPLTLAIAAIRSIMSRGWGLGSKVVILGFVAPLIWIGLFLTMVILILKFKRG